MAIEFQTGAEETHKIGEEGAAQIRRWLDSTYRFKIYQSIYDLDPAGKPYPKLRVPQLVASPEGANPEPPYERFDLIGTVLDENGVSGNTLYVECKKYSQAGNQGTLYDEYLAVCYSAFVHLSRQVGAPIDVEFMWATTHPFSLGNYANLTTADQIQAACAAHPDRLGDEAFDMSIARQLEGRLWLAVVNQRVNEMIMGLELQKVVVARILELGR
jgi:hypothetical protein